MKRSHQRSLTSEYEDQLLTDEPKCSYLQVGKVHQTDLSSPVLKASIDFLVWKVTSAANKYTFRDLNRSTEM